MLIRRKEVKRIPKKTTFAFLVEFKAGHWCLGVKWASSDTTMFNAFFDSETAEITDEHWKDVLFTSGIMHDFFLKNRIMKVEIPDWVTPETVDIPKQALRPRDVPYEEGQVRGWDGIWHEKGVDLVPLDPPYLTFDGAGPMTPALKENLNCEEDLELLLKFPLAVAIGGAGAMERLECCRLLGHDFDPYKAKLFPDCEGLDQGIARKTSWFCRGNMPLLGLKVDEETNRLVPE